MKSKKYFSLLIIFIGVLLLGASCKKGLPGAKLEPFSLSGELKDGGCCLGITTGAGGEAKGKINVNTISVKVNADSTFTGEYTWDSMYVDKTLAGKNMNNYIKDKGQFEGKIDSSGQATGSYQSDYQAGFSSADTPLMTQDYNSAGEVKGEITQGKIAIYFTVPTIKGLMEGYMVGSLQSTADNSGDPLHSSYYYFEKGQ